MNVHEPDGFLKVMTTAHKYFLEEAERDILIYKVLQLRKKEHLLLQCIAGICTLNELAVESLLHDPI